MNGAGQCGVGQRIALHAVGRERRAHAVAVVLHPDVPVRAKTVILGGIRKLRVELRLGKRQPQPGQPRQWCRARRPDAIAAAPPRHPAHGRAVIV